MNIGWLHKRSSQSLFMNWKRRYFILVDGVNFEYYTDTSRTVLKGKYCLSACCEVKIVPRSSTSGPTEFLFSIEDKRLKTSNYLGADTEEDRIQWIEMLKENINELEQHRISRLRKTETEYDGSRIQ